MATIADIIDDIRFEISDQEEARFSDADILRVFKKAIHRAEKTMIRLGVPLVKVRSEQTTTIDQAYITLPTSPKFILDISVWNDSGNHDVVQESELAWEQLGTDITQASRRIYDFNSDSPRLLLKGTPTEEQTLVLWYFATCDPDSMTTSSNMPWGDRLNDIIEDYVIVRLQNVDEIATVDNMQLLADLESRIQDVFMPLSARITHGAGPFSE